jgi:membrane protein
MNVRASEVKSDLLTIYGEFKEREVSFMAGSVAYNAFTSLIPLLVLSFILAAVVGGEQLANRMTNTLGQFLTPQATEMIGAIVENASEQTGLSILGLAILLWSALKLFRTLDVAFSDIYGTVGEDGIIDQLRDAILVLGAIVLAVAIAAAASIAFAVLNVPFIGLLNPILLIVGLTVAFFPMYYFFPDADWEPRDALPGAFVAALGWTLLQVVFQIYVAASAEKMAVYGAIGVVLLIVTWLYFGSLVILLGAIVNAVLADETPEETGPQQAFEATGSWVESANEPPSNMAVPTSGDDGKSRGRRVPYWKREKPDRAPSRSDRSREAGAPTPAKGGDGGGQSKLKKLGSYAAMGLGGLLVIVGVVLRRRSA